MTNEPHEMTDAVVEIEQVPTEADIQRWVEEAERGYDVEQIRANPGGITPLYAVAWAMWAGEDATYSAGVYIPDNNELELAKSFIETLRSRGFDVVKRPNRDADVKTVIKTLVPNSKLPEWMQLPALGQDMRPLAELVVDALMDTR